MTGSVTKNGGRREMETYDRICDQKRRRREMETCDRICDQNGGGREMYKDLKIFLNRKKASEGLKIRENCESAEQYVAEGSDGNPCQ